MDNLVHVLAEIEEFDLSAYNMLHMKSFKKAKKYVNLIAIDSAGYPVYEFAFDEPGDEQLYIQGKLKIPNVLDYKIFTRINPDGSESRAARIYLNYKNTYKMNSSANSQFWYQINAHEKKRQEMLYIEQMRSLNQITSYDGSPEPTVSKKNNSILLLL